MIPMADEKTPERPPTSGRGSSVEAWREYAAASTESTLESWAALSREEIIALLDGEGAATEQEADRNAAAARDERVDHAPRPRQRPVWMVPTEDGDVPEHDLRGR